MSTNTTSPVLLNSVSFTATTPQPRTSTILGSIKAIEVLDLSQIKMKLMLPTRESEGWSREQADIGEKWYKCFLILHAMYPNHRNVPNSMIDAFWHTHILDTRKYASDCEVVFGKFLHHYPYFGLNGDSETRNQAFIETNQLYRMEFGEDCVNILAKRGQDVGMDCSDPCTTDNPVSEKGQGVGMDCSDPCTTDNP